MTTGITISLRGPIFRPNAPLRVKRMVRGIVQGLVELGEQRLDEMLRPRPDGVFLSVAEAGKQASTGNYRRNVHGEVKSSVLGVITDSGVVYGPWLEGTSSRNQTTRFKGYSSFRRTGQWLQKEAPKVAQRHVAHFVGEIS